jgi:hypothetical protein
VHNVGEEKKTLFSPLKLEGYSQSWWEIYTKTLRLEGDPLVTKWEVFKNSIKPKFYTIKYEEEQRFIDTTTDIIKGKVYKSTLPSS